MQCGTPHPVPKRILGDQIISCLQQHQTKISPIKFGNGNVPHDWILVFIPNILIKLQKLPPQYLCLSQIVTTHNLVERGVVSEQRHIARHDGHLGKAEGKVHGPAQIRQIHQIAIRRKDDRNGQVGCIVGKDVDCGLQTYLWRTYPLVFPVRCPLLQEEERRRYYVTVDRWICCRWCYRRSYW